MKLLKMVGIAFFFLHYYVVIALAFVKNILIYLWRMIMQTHAEKHHISPYSATHSHVFAHIGTV